MPGYDAFGTSLSRGNGIVPPATTETFTPIGNITSLSPGGISRETLDVTAHDSPDQYMEFLGGLKDPGEVEFDVNLDPALHFSLLDDFEAPAPINYQVAFPDGTTLAFGTILTGFDIDAPYDDKLSASITMKITSKPVVTLAA